MDKSRITNQKGDWFRHFYERKVDTVSARNIFKIDSDAYFNLFVKLGI